VSERLHDNQAPIVAKVYKIYEEALRARNVMDFNGLILDTCRLMKDVPTVAARIRSSYPFWLIDEFQDTSPAQYKLLRLIAGDEFKNVFAVADDDQIIYQWAGASYRQIELFREQFQPELIQLVENHRCPPDVVEAANRLVAFNTRRTPNKQPIIPTRSATGASIMVREFDSEISERDTLAAEILAGGESMWGKTAILARNRQMLALMLETLRKCGIKAVLSQRRDRFISPQFGWLQACLDQLVRPTDRIVFRVLVDAANRIGNLTLEPAILIAEAEAAGHSYLHQWSLSAVQAGSPVAVKLAELANRLMQSRAGWREIVKQAITVLSDSVTPVEGIVSDAEEDRTAWDACVREIRSEKGSEPDLNELIQGISLRSKEPPRDPNSVVLMTVHAAKGLEFDFVYVISMAESVMPSWQSIQKGDRSVEMEEERRNCFVAITRTRQRLALSYACAYGTWTKAPSRFLKEMALTASVVG